MTEKRLAILIAGSKFPEEPGLTELRCPEHDVDALNKLLRSPDFGQFTETVVFKNASSHEVLEKIETVLADAGREDLVLIYFSGHGKLNSSGQLCLATVNTKLKALGSTSIPIERIKSFFDAASTRKRILILDCCYSGAAGAEFVRGSVDDQLQLMSGGQGTFIMTASTGFQTAVEKPDDSLGLFTKHLVEGIRSGEADKDEDGFISVHELYEYVHEKVRAEGAQEPMKWGLQTKGSMIIAKSGRNAKQLADERISTGDFVESWDKTCLEPESPPVPSSRLKLLVFILAAVSCAGAGWYFLSSAARPMPDSPLPPPAMGRISVSKRLIPSLPPSALSPRPLSPPIMSKISVSRQAIPSLSSQRKLQPLPQAERMSQNGTTIGQYIDHGNGTITDTASSLMWKRCSEGLSGVNCEKGEVEKYEYDEAVERFKNVEYAGYSDWRLPTIDELKTLVYCSNGEDKYSCNLFAEKPTINQQAFPNTEAWGYWSRPPAYYSDADGAWLLYFDFGGSGYGTRDFNYAVRLVRGGQ